MSGRFFSVIFALLCSTLAYAQVETPGAVKSLFEKLSENSVCMEYDYSLHAELPLVGSGELILQGTCYRLEGDGLVVCSDGERTITMDAGSKEVVIESAGLFSDANPASLFANIQTSFDLMRTEVKSGKYILSYVPKEDIGVLGAKIVVYNDRIEKADFRLEDGSVLAVTISKMEMFPKRPSSFFSMDLSTLGTDYIVTDMR